MPPRGAEGPPRKVNFEATVDSERRCEARSSHPHVAQFRAHKFGVRSEFASAPGSLDDGVRWGLELEKKGYDELGDSGMFPTLDSKHEAALGKAMTGEPGRQNNL